MIALAKKYDLLEAQDLHLKHEHNEEKVIVFERANLFFVFNFHPTRSHVDYRIEADAEKYRMIIDTDAGPYGGHDRLTPEQIHYTLHERMNGGKRNYLSLYLPARTAMVLKKM